MLKFNADNFEELQEEFNQKSLEISIEIVKSVIEGLEMGVDKVELGVMSKIDIVLSVHSDSYLEALRTNLQRCEDAEEFELCAKALEWINKLATKE